MQPGTAPQEAADSAKKDEQRQAAGDGGAGLEGAADIAEATLDGTLGALADGAVAVAEGAVNVVGAVLGGLIES